ncbi:MAG TPA: hypothetical protein VET66_12175 [Steroidobacteraceae bacterium]|nr:hypothetical protein [Steroidobacteraceae bacterium]
MLPASRVPSILLRGAFVLALLLGLGFWFFGLSPDGPVGLVHMLLGLTVVGTLWYLGLAQAQRGGSLGLTLGTFFLGLVVAIFGLAQTALKSALHGEVVVNIIHLLLGLAAIGLGEMCAARIKRATTPKVA